MIMVNIIVTTYFVTLYAYPLLFLFYSFQENLPWGECNNPWNTIACVKVMLCIYVLLNYIERKSLFLGRNL